MQVRYFLIVFVFFFSSGIYFWYKVEEGCKHKKFIQEVEYSMILLTALDNNKTEIAKHLLAADVDRFFILIANGEKPQKYSSLCRIIDGKNILLLKSLEVNDKKIIKVFQDINKTNSLVRMGMQLFSNYCQNHRL